MSIDVLQDKIRKLKNPSVIDLSMSVDQLPPHLITEEGSVNAAISRFYREMLSSLKGVVPAVRFGFASFTMLGIDGLRLLSETLFNARQEGFYVFLDVPELLCVKASENAASVIFGERSPFPCDGLLVSSYLGSDILKPFLPYCKNDKRDVFSIVRTANKSGTELQDLLSGTRLVHAAAADIVNRYGADAIGKCGYSRVSIMAAASSAESLRSLRAKYPRLFLLLDGLDYPNSNAKNCSYAFDKLGRGAVVSAGCSVTCAWKLTESDGSDYLEQALIAADRIKKNLTRYITIL